MGGAIGGSARYIQYRADLATSDPAQSPALQQVSICYTVTGLGTPTASPAPATATVTMVPATPTATVTMVPATPTATQVPTSSTPTRTPVGLTCFGDTTAADFGLGTGDSGIYIAQTGDGEVMLAPTVGAEFSGTALPAGWSSTPWNPGGAATVSGGHLSVDGALVATDAYYGLGRSLEFVATFATVPNQHAGFGVDVDSTPFWAMFSTKQSTNTLYARTNNNGSVIDTPLGTNLLSAPHRFRIDWNPNSVVFYIDDTQVDAQPVAITTNMRPLASDYAADGTSLVVDWLRMSPYASSGTFVSRVFDAGGSVNWDSLNWTANVPTNTSLTLSVRTGDTPNPDNTWTAWQMVPASGGSIGGSARYIQYRAELTTSDAYQSPVLQQVNICYIAAPTHTPTATAVPPTATPTSPPTTTPTSTATTPPTPVCTGDSTVADFASGTPDANSYIAQTGDGEVMLMPALGAEFSGTTLPSGWTSTAWGSGGTATVANGLLTVDGARVGPAATYTPGRVLEFVATFGAAPFQHVGFGVTYDTPDLRWAMFSTKDTTNTLYARTNINSGNTGAEVFTAIPGSWLGTPHRYRIEWNASSVLYYVDGVLKVTHNVSLAGSLRPLVSDFTAAGPTLTVDWLRMSPLAASSTFMSRVFDAAGTVYWSSMSWAACAARKHDAYAERAHGRYAEPGWRLVWLAGDPGLGSHDRRQFSLYPIPRRPGDRRCQCQPGSGAGESLCFDTSAPATNTPTRTPTTTASNTPTATASNTPTATASNTPTATASNTPVVHPQLVGHVT